MALHDWVIMDGGPKGFFFLFEIVDLRVFGKVVCNQKSKTITKSGLFINKMPMPPSKNQVIPDPLIYLFWHNKPSF